MSDLENSRERWLAARAAIADVREQLQKPAPGSIKACSASLQFAVEQLRSLRSGGPDAGWTGPGETEELARELADVQDLLRQAAAFYLSWLRVLQSASGTYGSDGALRTACPASVTTHV